MITGKITQEDYSKQYVTCKESGCCYVQLLDAGLDFKDSDFEMCKKCGVCGVIKKELFSEVK